MTRSISQWLATTQVEQFHTESKRLTTEALLDASAESGKDESGITHYLATWLQAFKARGAWPDMLLAYEAER